MAELTSRDRLQPSLLDRLIDQEPGNSRESVDARVLSRNQLRAAVLRDLSWLFNATCPEPEDTSVRTQERDMWRRNEYARRSVLNYGMPAFSGRTLSTLNTKGMARAVKQVILNFEPRIDPDTLDVKVQFDGGNAHNALKLVIKGFMWNQPVPLELLLSADVDIETGDTRVRDLRS